MYDPRQIIDLVAGNVRKTKNPLAVPKPVLNRWWRGRDLPRSGDALLFTGMMYQFVPYIEKSTAYLERFEHTRLAGHIGHARRVPAVLSGLTLAAMTPAREKKRYNGILLNIADLLTRSGVDFYYDPRLDEYSGILLYDLGDQEEFVRHANFVAGRLRAGGVRRVITVDPHTTYALKVLFPRYTGIELEVHAYFELLDLVPKNGGRKIALHDPCFYGRYLELSGVPAKILAGLDVECAPLLASGPYTTCCGGPAESMFPSMSRELAQRRISELSPAGTQIVAMCPICLGSLRKAGAQVEDLSGVLCHSAA